MLFWLSVVTNMAVGSSGIIDDLLTKGSMPLVKKRWEIGDIFMPNSDSSFEKLLLVEVATRG